MINSLDSTLANRSASALPVGDISISSSGGPDSSVGWSGYVFNRVTQQYLVRFRTYDTVLGRWLERDPAGADTLAIGIEVKEFLEADSQERYERWEQVRNQVWEDSDESINGNLRPNEDPFEELLRFRGGHRD
ncbi:MAG: hypothetical protein KF724_00010 [Phycisphaeraceae bacterium]|nr:hypothetical protein [Phycisphaeraceae bacterium]